MRILILFLLIKFLVLESGNAGSKLKTLNELGVNEESYLNWVQHIGHYNHSIFEEAKNTFITPCKTILVHKNEGEGDFTTIQNAIDSIPDFNDCRFVIYVSPGVYREKVEIPTTKAYVSLIGMEFGKTTIQWNDSAKMEGKDGKPMGTFGSATFAINSPYFIAKNITFKNKAPAATSGALGKQAVALRISGDNAAFIRCRFIGSQDTLYDHKGRHYFNKCYIQGSVDFIFGDGLSFYQDCHLHAKTHTYGALTAQKRESVLEETGFAFVNCRVTGSGALYLGRAWGNFSRVVFAFTYMDKIIIPKGWNDWGDTDRDMTVFYGQFKCSGPGAEHGGRVKWARELTEEEAKPFISLAFIDGQKWLTDV